MAKNTSNDIQDINLSVIQRKKFRIDGDDDRIIELNTTDMNILSRLKTAYPQLMELSSEAADKLPSNIELPDDGSIFDSEEISTAISVLTEVDKKMRELIDYIFDSNVADICAPFGSMYDMINGQFRFEHIIECLSNLYEQDLAKETKKLSARVRKHTDKYVVK